VNSIVAFVSGLDRRKGNLLGLAACAGLISYALFCQYGLHLQPCPLCILQRISVISAGLLFLVAALHDPADRGAKVYGVLIDLATLGGILVAARHMWIIAQPPGTVAECGASLEYMMDVLPLQDVLSKVFKGSGECARIDWHFLGLNMPTWVLMSLVVVGTWAIAVNWRLPRKRD
jgi:disulfide bond formation protein DsbB